MHIFLHLFFWLPAIMLALLIFGLFDEETRKEYSQSKGLFIALAVVLILVGGYSHNRLKVVKHQNQVRQAQLNRPNLLGHKINKHTAKKDPDGFYYVDKDDKNIKYFTENGKITAVKYDYRPNYQVGTNAVGHMKDIINDNNIKFGSEKQSANNELLQENHYNIYSPKYKKWYHTSIQRESKDHITIFTVWQGKSDSVDVDNAEE